MLRLASCMHRRHQASPFFGAVSRTDRITRPAGTVYVNGVAFSAGSPIRRVEASSGGDKNWTDAAFFDPDLGRFAWRRFALPMRMAAGNFVLVNRATDSAGNTQPEERLENAHGYRNNSWADHAVAVTVASRLCLRGGAAEWDRPHAVLPRGAVGRADRGDREVRVDGEIAALVRGQRHGVQAALCLERVAQLQSLRPRFPFD